jgi:hypothetical protein
MKLNWSLRWVVSGLVVVSSALPLPLGAQDCCEPVPCVTQRVMYKTVWDQERVEAQRVAYETVLVDDEITVQRPVYETETRTRTVRVGRPVIETSDREERYTTYRPVVVNEEREEMRLQTNWVTETQMREERRVVARPVVETQTRTERQVVRRPVTETVMQNQNYLVNEPVTTYSTGYVDQGGFVDQVTQTAPTTRYRLGWVPAGFQTTPETAWRHAGFGRIPYTTPGATVVNRQYVPNVVPVQVPQTTMVQKVVTQQVPVTVQKYVDEIVEQQIPVQVQRTEYDEVVDQIPVTVRKAVTEQVPHKYNVQYTKYEAVEVVKPVKVTTQRIQYEDVEQPYEVKVMKMVTETKPVKKRVAVKKLVPYTYYRLVPRTVQMVVNVDSFGNVLSSQELVPGPVIESRRIVSPAPTPAGKSVKKPAAQNGNGAKSETQKDEATKGESKAGEAKDSDPTGTPELDGKLELNKPNSAKEDTSSENDDSSV